MNLQRILNTTQGRNPPGLPRGLLGCEATKRGARPTPFPAPPLIPAALALRRHTGESQFRSRRNTAIASRLFCGSMTGRFTSLCAMGDLVTETENTIAKLQARVATLEHDLQELASVTSHDLMEPVRTIGGFLKLLEKQLGGRLAEEERQYLQFAVDGSERLREMLVAMLELSRVRTHGNTFAPVDIERLVDAACERLQPRLESTHGVVTRDPLPAVKGDAVQLLKALSGLIENAVLYAGDGAPKIHVRATVERGEGIPMATFAIRDEGIGIAPKFHDAVFVIFRRLQPRTKASGPGAGLTICKRIVEHHGGRMWVESTEGDGSTFLFTLPLASDDEHGSE